MSFLVTITTGPEKREFNGPLMVPIWDGMAPGYRAGQIYYDVSGTLDGTPGPIYWDGSAWKKYAIGTLRRYLQYNTATTVSAILNLSTVNSLFAAYDDVQVTNLTDATGNSISFKRTGASTWDYVIMNKLT